MRSINLSAVILVLAVRTAVAQGHQVTYLDLQPYSNQKLTQGLGNEGNNLAALPTGEQTLAGIKFKVGGKLIQLGSCFLPDHPEKVEDIKIDKAFSKLHILHACHQDVRDGAIIGYYTVRYEDKSEETIPIVYGKDVRDWWYYDASPAPTRGKVAWKGINDDVKNSGGIRLYVTTWRNPESARKVVSIDFGSTLYSPAAPFCVAITAEE